MAHHALSPRPITLAALDLAPRAVWMVLFGGLLLAGAWLVPLRGLAVGLIVAAMVFLILAGLVKALAIGHRRAEARLWQTLAEFAAHDAAPSLTTDRDGMVTYANDAAGARFGPAVGATLPSLMGDYLAAPTAVLYRLQNKALALGAAHEDLVVPGGQLRVSVHRIGAQGFVWRLEDRTGPDTAGAEAMGLPMMVVSQAGTILDMNEALRRLLGGAETALDRVFADLPLRPGELHHVTTRDGAKPVLLLEGEGAGPGSGDRRFFYLAPAARQTQVAPGEWGVVDRLPVPLLRLDRAGQVTMANRRARTLLATKSVVGKHLSDLVEDLGRPISDWLREAWSGRHLGRPETVRVSSGEERFVQITLEQFEDETGPALVAVLNDATALKSIERQVAQSQKMQLIGQLAGGVAHDFNNLLTAISGHCDLLLLKREPDDPDFADLSQIAQNANRAAAVVNQLLGFSRKQRLRPETLELTDTIADLTHLLGRLVGERVRLELEVDPKTPAIRADRFQLEQVLTNLVVNARDAMMPDGGRVRLKLSTMRLDRPLERDRAVVPVGDYVCIQVIDEGVGIAADKIDKIFEPFFSTKGTKGTGLGLSMAYGIVKQSGGYIFVDTVVGSGTTFSLYFPVLRTAVQAASAGDQGRATPPPAIAAPGPQSELPTQHPSGAQMALTPDWSDRSDRGGRPDWSDRGAQGGPQMAPRPPETGGKAGASGVPAAETPSAHPPENAAGVAPAQIAEPALAQSAHHPHARPYPGPPHDTGPQHPPAGQAGPALHGAEGRGTVLLVEDEAPVRAFAARALRLSGYTVLEADSAEQALALLEDPALAIDIFVTDVIMPGLDGPTWVAQALEQRPAVKVVFVSGYAEDSIAEHQARIPNSVFLPKPFSLTQLTNTVGAQLAA